MDGESSKMIESYTSHETIARAAQAAERAFFVGAAPGAEERDAELQARERAEVAVRRAEAHRLVKAAKSPTDPYPGLTGAYFNRMAPKNPPARRELDQPAPDFAPDLDQPGTWAVVERREWAGEYRLRMETRPGMGADTPDNAGDRITAMLTERGARKISESCYFMACKRGGFSTFLTLTLTPEARQRLREKTVEPARAVVDGWLRPLPEAARAKQGTFAPKYTEELQVCQSTDEAGPFAALDHESGRPYTPLKTAWRWSVQKEASRFFEAAGQMYRRGWQYQAPKKAGRITRDDQTGAEYTPIEYQTVRVPGSRALYCVEGPDRDKRTGAEFTRLKWWREPLAYLWVAENPNQEDSDGNPVADEWGELQTNPHIHVMMKWRVTYRHFRAWAARIERLWGQGTAHLEKIKDPQKAGSYVAKAAGYLSKAQGKTDQGEIRGNRYGISKRARAPGWIECERHRVGMMGWLLAEASEKWQEKHGQKIQRREKLKYKLEAANDTGERQKIGRLLEQVRGEIEPLPRISKYAALFKTEEQKTRFFQWARGHGWTEAKQCSQWLHQWRAEQWKRRHRGRLSAGPEAWAQWFALADAGAVACNDDEQGALCG